MIIGTSNLAKHLDDALWRRFDFALEFKAPSPKVLVSFAQRVASEMQVTLPEDVVARVAKAQSFAHAESMVVAEVRRQALRDL